MHILSDPQRPFDFIIHDQLLRKDLRQHLLENKLSTVLTHFLSIGRFHYHWSRILSLQETVLEIEYIPAVLPPKQQKSSPHDDWYDNLLSCCLARLQKTFFVGCFDAG